MCRQRQVNSQARRPSRPLKTAGVGVCGPATTPTGLCRTAQATQNCGSWCLEVSAVVSREVGAFEVEVSAGIVG
jgi:hypothetical protein